MAWTYRLTDDLLAGRRPGLADHPAVDRAVASAWATADPEGRGRLIQLLLKRGQTASLVTLIRHYGDLEPATRDDLARQLGQLHRPLRKALADGSTPTLLGGLSLILRGLELAEHGVSTPDSTTPATAAEFHADGLAARAEPSNHVASKGGADLGRAGLLGLVAERLRHADAGVRDAAGGVYLRLAEPGAGGDGRSAAAVASAVGEAVQRYAVHRHPAVLRAWLGLGLGVGLGRGKTLAALEDVEHPAVGALRELLQDGGTDEADPVAAARVARGLVPALLCPTLAMAAVRGLRRLVQRGGLEWALIGNTPLLELTAVRRVLSRACEPADLLPSPLRQGQKNTPRRLGGEEPAGPAFASAQAEGGADGSFNDPAWVAWLAALPLGTLGRSARWAWLCRHGGPAVRLAAVRALGAASDPAERDPRAEVVVRGALRSAAEKDPEPAIARLAAVLLLARAAKEDRRGNRPSALDQRHGPETRAALTAALSGSRHAGVVTLAQRRSAARLPIGAGDTGAHPGETWSAEPRKTLTAYSMQPVAKGVA